LINELGHAELSPAEEGFQQTEVVQEQEEENRETVGIN